MGQYLGKETMLVCKVTASPQGSNIWRFGRREPATEESWNYNVESYYENKYTTALTLRIKNLRVEDYGLYTCEASNGLGRAAAEMELYGTWACTFMKLYLMIIVVVLSNENQIMAIYDIINYILVSRGIWWRNSQNKNLTILCWISNFLIIQQRVVNDHKMTNWTLKMANYSRIGNWIYPAFHFRMSSFRVHFDKKEVEQSDVFLRFKRNRERNFIRYIKTM